MRAEPLNFFNPHYGRDSLSKKGNYPPKKDCSYQNRGNGNGNNGKNNGHHPRHRNDENVEQGKCPRCVILYGEKNVPLTDIEEHHDEPVRYGGVRGPKRKTCPVCHMEVEILIKDYTNMLAIDHLPEIVEISERHYNGEELGNGDLYRILARARERDAVELLIEHMAEIVAVSNERKRDGKEVTEEDLRNVLAKSVQGLRAVS